MELSRLAVQLLETNAEKRKLEARADFIKEHIYQALVEMNKGEVIIPVGSDEEIVVRNNVRTTKSFDKDGLAELVYVDREDVDYAGVAVLVDEGKVTANRVAEFQHENRSEFISVRTRKVIKKKKKGRKE